MRLVRKIIMSLTLVLISLLSIAHDACAEDTGKYLAITGPCNLTFPQDHGAHPGHKTEWWYWTGNLQSPAGERYGFQLTFFRSQIVPPGAKKSWPRPASAWRTTNVFLAHAALSDISAGRYLHAEQAGRQALGLADASVSAGITTVFIKNWSANLEAETQHLKAVADDFSLDLSLIPAKDPALHGNAGYSLKGSTPERASCYYSFTRLETRGRLTLNGKRVAVQGQSWMDHEFSSAPLENGLKGWDWFSLQFSDGTELMIYLLRKEDGTAHDASSGTYVDVSGKAMHLIKDDFKVEPLTTWKSPHSGGIYPSRWRIVIPSLALNIAIIPNLPDQEMQASASLDVTYWEGSVAVTGTRQEQPLAGQGYVELTGYAKLFDAL